jgi:hypothetical protein
MKRVAHPAATRTKNTNLRNRDWPAKVFPDKLELSGEVTNPPKH